MRTLTRLPQSVGGESRVTLLLLVIAVTGLPWGIVAQEWLDDDLVLLLMALLAVVTGFVLGRWPVNGLVSLAEHSSHAPDPREQARAWGIWERWRNWLW